MTCLVSSHLYDRLQCCGGCINGKLLLFIFYKSVYECHPYKTVQVHTHIALRPLNQDENKLMIYVLLNIHEGNPWLMWEKSRKTKMLMWKSGQNSVRYVGFSFSFFVIERKSHLHLKLFRVVTFKCLNFVYWRWREDSCVVL